VKLAEHKRMQLAWLASYIEANEMAISPQELDLDFH
jgi:hypothetical protein